MEEGAAKGGGDTHTQEVCVCAEAERIMGVTLV